MTPQPQLTDRFPPTRGVPVNGIRKRLAALKSFNVRSYLLGSSLSYIGTRTQTFAQWWLVLTISGNPVCQAGARHLL